MITVKQSGSYKLTEKFMTGALKFNFRNLLEKYGKKGVGALSSATPKDTGITADSWDYEITKTRKGWAINWKNSNVVNGVPVVVLIQYGHGTSGGGWVAGRDFVNPAVKPILSEIVDNLEKELNKL